MMRQTDSFGGQTSGSFFWEGDLPPWLSEAQVDACVAGRMRVRHRPLPGWFGVPSRLSPEEMETFAEARRDGFLHAGTSERVRLAYRYWTEAGDRPDVRIGGGKKLSQITVDTPFWAWRLSAAQRQDMAAAIAEHGGKFPRWQSGVGSSYLEVTRIPASRSESLAAALCRIANRGDHEPSPSRRRLGSA